MERTKAGGVSREGWTRILFGHLLVALGAFIGAFGAVAWIAPLALTSPAEAIFGALVFAFCPGLVGLAIIWSGLELLTPKPPSLLSDDLLLAALGGGATRDEVAKRIGIIDARRVEERLDALVLRERLDLTVTEEGALVYAPNHPGHAEPAGALHA